MIPNEKHATYEVLDLVGLYKLYKGVFSSEI
jgi:hypothetical protein